MAINEYYEDELSYLREMGDLFARENPKLAGSLSRDAADPDVERLLEGFAFLTGRLRAQLENELPELAHGLIRLLWPHYLRPVPPMTIIGFDMAANASDDVVSVPRGTILESQPVNGTPCRFSTSYDVHVLPVKVTKAALDNQATSAQLRLSFKLNDNCGLGGFAANPLRLFFNVDREPLVGRTLYLWMQRHMREVQIEPAGGKAFSVRPGDLKPLGLEDKDAVLPYPANAFSGFRILQEYLAFPKKFMFVELARLGQLARSDARTFTITFGFSRPLPDQVRVSERMFTVNATPAVNLFEHTAHPLTVDHARSEYRIKPTGGPGYSIHSVNSVVGFVQGRGARVPYSAFESFAHDLPGDDQVDLYYRIRLRNAVIGRGVDHFITFIDQNDKVGVPETETISIGLTCSNGQLAEQIPVGGINRPTASSPGSVVFSNVSGVSAEVPPPIHDAVMWRLIANLARNFGSIVDVDALRTVIAAYDFAALRNAQARQRLSLLLEGFSDFRMGTVDVLVKGRPVRARRLTLTVEEAKVGGEGEMFLLGAVLNAYFTAYASINSLHQFAITGKDTKASYRWTPRIGAVNPF